MVYGKLADVNRILLEAPSDYEHKPVDRLGIWLLSITPKNHNLSPPSKVGAFGPPPKWELGISKAIVLTVSMSYAYGN
jgi:hypothetical protein